MQCFCRQNVIEIGTQRRRLGRRPGQTAGARQNQRGGERDGAQQQRYAVS
jgi:hypothetical protein